MGSDEGKRRPLCGQMAVPGRAGSASRRSIVTAAIHRGSSVKSGPIRRLQPSARGAVRSACVYRPPSCCSGHVPRIPNQRGHSPTDPDEPHDVRAPARRCGSRRRLARVPDRASCRPDVMRRRSPSKPRRTGDAIPDADAPLADVLAIRFPTGLDSADRAKKKSARSAALRWWVQDMSKRAAAARTAYSTASSRARQRHTNASVAAARIVQLQRHLGEHARAWPSFLSTVTQPARTRTRSLAAFCDRLEEVAEPILLGAEGAAKVCASSRDELAHRLVDARLRPHACGDSQCRSAVQR